MLSLSVTPKTIILCLKHIHRITYLNLNLTRVMKLVLGYFDDGWKLLGQEQSSSDIRSSQHDKEYPLCSHTTYYALVVSNQHSIVFVGDTGDY